MFRFMIPSPYDGDFMAITKDPFSDVHLDARAVQGATSGGGTKGYLTVPIGLETFRSVLAVQGDPGDPVGFFFPPLSITTQGDPVVENPHGEGVRIRPSHRPPHQPVDPVGVEHLPTFRIPIGIQVSSRILFRFGRDIAVPFFREIKIPTLSDGPDEGDLNEVPRVRLERGVP